MPGHPVEAVYGRTEVPQDLFRRFFVLSNKNVAADSLAIPSSFYKVQLDRGADTRVCRRRDCPGRGRLTDSLTVAAR